MSAPTSPLQYGYPLTCPHCEAKFTREHQLAAHLTAAHPEIALRQPYSTDP